MKLNQLSRRRWLVASPTLHSITPLLPLHSFACQRAALPGIFLGRVAVVKAEADAVVARKGMESTCTVSSNSASEGRLRRRQDVGWCCGSGGVRFGSGKRGIAGAGEAAFVGAAGVGAGGAWKEANWRRLFYGIGPPF